jgi:hypothetical protein
MLYSGNVAARFVYLFGCVSPRERCASDRSRKLEPCLEPTSAMEISNTHPVVRSLITACKPRAAQLSLNCFMVDPASTAKNCFMVDPASTAKPSAQEKIEDS